MHTHYRRALIYKEIIRSNFRIRNNLLVSQQLEITFRRNNERSRSIFVLCYVRAQINWSECPRPAYRVAIGTGYLRPHYHDATNSREIRCHYDDQMHIDTLKPPDVDDK